MLGLYEIMETIVGTPQNETQTTVLYLISCGVGLITIYYVLYIFKLCAQILKR